MANIIKSEVIEFRNLQSKNPNIKNYLGSEKISETTFSGFKHHMDDIVPYERNYSKTNIDAKGLNSNLSANLNKIPEAALVSDAVVLKEENDEINKSGENKGLTMPGKKEEETTEREREKADDRVDEYNERKSEAKVYKHSHRK